MLKDGDWTKLPPREHDESPEEIRRQRDLYRDIVDKWVLDAWQNLTPDDLKFNPNSESEIHVMIAELEAETGNDR